MVARWNLNKKKTSDKRPDLITPKNNVPKGKEYKIKP